MYISHTSQKAFMNARSPYIRPFALTPAMWQFMEQVCVLHRKGELHQQPGGAMGGGNYKELCISKFISWTSIPESNRMELLSQLANKQISLVTLDRTAKEIKKMVRLRKAFLVVSGEESWDAAMDKYPDATTDKNLERFVRLFKSRTSASKDIPVIFKDYVQRAMKPFPRPVVEQGRGRGRGRGGVLGPLGARGKGKTREHAGGRGSSSSSSSHTWQEEEQSLEEVEEGQAGGCWRYGLVPYEEWLLALQRARSGAEAPNPAVQSASNDR
jgi:hypothetical protein